MDEYRQAERERSMFEYRGAIAPVLKDLAAAGARVDSIVELRRDRALYRAALPVLLDWFQRTDNVDVKMEIAGMLANKWASPTAAKVLIEGFRAVGDASLRWSIGSALSDVATKADFDAIVELVEDRRYGRGRQMLAEALGKMKDPRAVDTLVRLLNDPEVVGHAVVALGKLRAGQARPQVEALLKHEIAWIRKAAKTALARMT
jgi:HEAT repeat protein